MMEEKEYDLEDRLIEFAVLAMEVAEALPRSDSGRYLSGQMIRSGTSPALVYGEATKCRIEKGFYTQNESRIERIKGNLYKSKDHSEKRVLVTT